VSGWIGVDLDGTLAAYDGWQGIDKIGAAIPAMRNRVQGWIDEGKDVRIFTARVSCAEPERSQVIGYIGAWCVNVFGVALPVTNEKDFGMVELWDDRAVQVIPNTGKRADGEAR